MGFGVLGAVAAISGFGDPCVTYFPTRRMNCAARLAAGKASLGETVQAIVFFVGQVIISNIDILMVKHFFPPDLAGLYAAIALVGRLLYFGAWSVVSAMFPVSAGTNEERQTPALLALPLLMVTAMSQLFVLLLAAFPQLVFRRCSGRTFVADVGGT